ncbi:uncharacterized protein LOC124356132 [Homalodisca vitripennis]|uniref:uncharacterized protein LOC124356132 n=1 Tax=Homalodisca vitripennis TaxID=197043 RepID=UPI001EEB586F|nr:uncharacterized protein LOC124356132 [Homalodisca vitripennis]
MNFLVGLILTCVVVTEWMGQSLLNYYGFLNNHFILSRYDNDLGSVQSEDFEELVQSDTAVANIKPRKTKFVPQSFHNCSFCGKWYRSKTSLGLHRRLECGKEPAFQCPYCPLKTHQKGNLQVHIKKKHTGENSEGQSLKNRNPILAHELGMMPQNLSAQQLGINREISSELTITRAPSGTNPVTYSRTPNLSHILSQPNKARGITQFPLSTTESIPPPPPPRAQNNQNTIPSSRVQNNQNKVRVKGVANIPSGIVVTQRNVPPERRLSDVAISPSDPPKNFPVPEVLVQINELEEPLSIKNSEGTSKQTDIKKLPELTRILNSQEPIPPPTALPMILDSFSISNSSTVEPFKNEPKSPSREVEIVEIPDSTDKGPS